MAFPWQSVDVYGGGVRVGGSRAHKPEMEDTGHDNERTKKGELDKEAGDDEVFTKLHFVFVTLAGALDATTSTCRV